MSAKIFCGNQGGTTGYMSRPFWGGAFFMGRKSAEKPGLCLVKHADGQRTAHHYGKTTKKNGFNVNFSTQGLTVLTKVLFYT